MESEDPFGILEGPAQLDSPIPALQEEAELASKLSSALTEAKSIRQPWDQQWELNHQVLRGNQLILRNVTTGEVQYLVRDTRKRLLAINNVLRPTARALLGKLTKNISTWGCVPASDDLSDMQASEVIEALLQYHRRRLNFDQLYIRWYKSAVEKSIGIFQLYWDPLEGPKSAECPDCDYIAAKDEAEVGDPCPHCLNAAEMEHQDQQAQLQAQADAQFQQFTPSPFDPEQVQKLQESTEGDVGVDLVGPFEFYVDPSATSLENAQWVCRSRPIPVAKLRKMFPEKAAELEQDGIVWTERGGTLFQAGMGTTARTRPLKDHAYLHEFHEAPTAKYPKGAIIWMANNRILKIVESPYYSLLKRFPFYLSYWEKSEEEFYGESFIEQAWHLQRELNVLRTQIREHRELTLRPRLVNPLNSGIQIDEIDTAAGRILTVNPMFANLVRFMDHPAMPNYVPQEQDYLAAGIRNQATVTDHEAGNAPSDNSGRFAAILEAQSDQQVGPVLKFNAAEFVALGHGIAALCHANYRDERTWTIFGDDRPQSYVFKQARAGEWSDVVVHEDDALSHNPAVRFEQVLKLVQVPGYYQDPKTGQFDTKTFARDAKLKSRHLGNPTLGSDRAAAAALPSQVEEWLQTGRRWTPEDARPWDDPDVWAQELLAWLKSSGRNKDADLVANVQEAWQFYTQQSQAALQALQGQQSSGGAEGMKPEGGGPQGPKEPSPLSVGGQAPPSAKSTSPVPEAQAGVRQADAAAEAAAKPGNHEG